MLVPHIHAVIGEVEDILAVGLNAVEEKCVYFSTGGDHRFICHLPNTHERD